MVWPRFAVRMAVCALGLGLLGGCAEHESGPVVTSEQATGDTRQAKFTTVDGWTIYGDLYEPEAKPKGVAILLHQRGGSAEDYHAVGVAIAQAGYSAFAIDQRGTGRSAVGPGQSGDLAPWDVTGDIDGAVFAMKERGPLALVGASYGANNAIRYAATHPGTIRSLVLLSPSTDYSGLKTMEAVRKFKGPLLIFHGKNDKIANTGPAALLAASASKDKTLQVIDGAGHGAALLNADTTNQIVEFVARTLK